MNLIVTKAISIQALPSKVWSAFTDPDLNKKYFSSVNTPKAFAFDEGKILDAIPEKLLHTVYPGAINGEEKTSFDVYHIIYELEAEAEATTVRITHQNIDNEEQAKKITAAWEQFLLAMKKILEEEIE